MDSSNDHPTLQTGAKQTGPTLFAPKVLQRTITLSARPGHVDGRVEDNVHDFAVAIDHDDVHVTEIVASATRVPWTSCPLAVHVLDALVGTPLAGGGRGIDASQQCTHLLDLARLTIAQATREGARRYDITIAPEAAAGAARAQLWRDGGLILDWLLQEDVVTVGGPFVGHLTIGRAIWPAAVDTHPELIEAALILRRCLLVFRGRPRANAHVERASDMPNMAGACFSFQPERSTRAVRPPGFIDYARAPIKAGLR